MPKENKLNKPLIPKAAIPGNAKTNIRIFPQRSQEEIRRLNQEKIYFSFKFLDLKHPAFNCGEVESSWFLHCFDNFKHISDLTFNELEQQRQHYDLHRHDFNKTTHHYSESIAEEILEQISLENMIQFRLSLSGGRVHGIRYHNTIYVIWLDPYHNMNWDSRYGPPKHYETPTRPYEILQQQVNLLHDIIREKEKEIASKENDIKHLFEMLEECEDRQA
ncbi:hypothetical protein G3M81_05265 [Bacillus paralicheniformis]|uniref:hypothetical protein n=1 Tax=Bacillus TaxID=1386 RepID=UPI0013EF205C|nr:MULTISPECIES: hypothetical protein [Bacillus]MCY8074259.1 hypothetical protein [Bacillus haynesii]MEC1451635.1 hypothetical protein [Bacillus haynesii]QII48171.1 hypothetical protein G3M81_05265 [Bacillus paralicheniformis]